MSFWYAKNPDLNNLLKAKKLFLFSLNEEDLDQISDFLKSVESKDGDYSELKKLLFARYYDIYWQGTSLILLKNQTEKLKEMGRGYLGQKHILKINFATKNILDYDENGFLIFVGN